MELGIHIAIGVVNHCHQPPHGGHFGQPAVLGGVHLHQHSGAGHSSPTPIHLTLVSGLMQAHLDEQLPQRFVAEVDVVVQG
jgi:hypothetical protein